MINEGILFALIALLAVSGLRLELAGLGSDTQMATRFVWLGRTVSIGAAVIAVTYALYLYT